MTDSNNNDIQNNIKHRGYMIGFCTTAVYMLILYLAEAFFGIEFASGGVAAGIGFYLVTGITISHDIICNTIFSVRGNGLATNAAVFIILGTGAAIRLAGDLIDTGGSYITDGKINLAAAELIGMTVCLTLGILTVIRIIADRSCRKKDSIQAAGRNENEEERNLYSGDN